MSLRHRIAAVAGLAVAVSVLVAAGAIFFAVRGQLHRQIDDALRARASELADHSRDDGAGCGEGVFPASTDRDDARLGGAEGYAQLVCADGTVLRPAGATTPLPISERTRTIARSGSGETLASTTVNGIHMRVLTRATPAWRGAIQVARPLTEVDHSLRQMLAILLVVAAAGIALGAALGAVVARAALAPVRRFTRRTEEITGKLDPAERIDAKGDDELARLASSFNATLDALQRSVDAQRHLVADASHELRTPMASLRANIQTLEQADRLAPDDRAALRADILAELDELTDLVADVVELARGSTPGRVLDDVLVDRIAAALIGRAEGRSGVAVRFRAELEPTVIRGEPDRVNRAISNLLDNAVKWSPAGSVVDVALRDGTLTVRDRGPGFADADLPHVFERFYRADSSRGTLGSGLGLAIVRQAAEAHGGHVEAANAVGGGAEIHVRFTAPAGSFPQNADVAGYRRVMTTLPGAVAPTNEEAVRAWDTVLYERWKRNRRVFVGALEGLTDDVFARVPPPYGGRCIDVGCGFGETTRRLAQLVGPEGFVLGTDSSPHFIADAREEAARVANVAFEVADAQTAVWEPIHDYAFSRMGTQFFAAPVPAMRAIRGALKPGATLCMICWRRKPESPMWAEVEEVVQRFLTRPEEYEADTCGPGPFSLGNPDTTRGILEAAGFGEIAFAARDFDYFVGADMDEALDAMLAIGPGAELIRLNGERGERRRGEIASALAALYSDRQRPDGSIYGQAGVWVVTATA